MQEVVEVVEVVKVLGPCCSPKVMVAQIPRIQLNAHFVEKRLMKMKLYGARYSNVN